MYRRLSVFANFFGYSDKNECDNSVTVSIVDFY